jgi:hypothetical protein
MRVRHLLRAQNLIHSECRAGVDAFERPRQGNEGTGSRRLTISGPAAPSLHGMAWGRNLSQGRCRLSGAARSLSLNSISGY